VTPKILLAAVATIALATAGTGWAALGQPASSVSADQARLRGEVHATMREGFSVHEIAAADGRLVREFVSPAGMVFGVAWEGPTLPNLAELLGPYFVEFQRAAHASPRRRGPVVVRTERLVVESGGHLRAFHGRAYVPDLVPAAASASAVR